MPSTNTILEAKVFSKFKKDTWEVKTVEEIAEKVYIGNEISRDQLGSGNYPAIKCGDITSDKLDLSFEKCISFVDINIIKTKKYFEYGDLLVANFSDATKVGKATVYLGKEKCLAGKGVTVVKHNLNPKFLSFIWSTKFVRDQIVKSSLQGTVFNFWSEKVKEIKIPIAPPEIQQQIVEFLDKFMKLEKELVSEMENRKIQYEYYKNLIFNRGINEKNWELKTIEEIATEIYSGNEITKAQLGTGNHPAIRIKEIYDSKLEITDCVNFVDPNLIKKKKYSSFGDILLASTSENIRDFGKSCVYLGKEKCLVGNDIKIIKHNQNPRYLAYSLTTESFQKEIKKCAEGGNVLHLYTKKLLQIKIPLPPLEIQNEVVEQLDKLYRIINDLKDGIPMLIQKNKEQYNYYKELLLKK